MHVGIRDKFQLLMLWLPLPSFFFFFLVTFIYLAMLGLSCSIQDLIP